MCPCVHVCKNARVNKNIDIYYTNFITNKLIVAYVQ